MEREAGAMTVVACRFEGFVVESATLRSRVLNLVRFISNAAFASS